MTSRAVPIAFARVCEKCVALDSSNFDLCTKSKAKERYLLTDNDLSKATTTSVVSPFQFGRKDTGASSSNGGSASSESNCSVMLMSDVKKVALGKYKTEAGLEAEFDKVFFCVVVVVAVGIFEARVLWQSVGLSVCPSHSFSLFLVSSVNWRQSESTRLACLARSQ